MKEFSSDDQTENLLNCIVESMRDKKAHDITSIDLRGLQSAVTDIFVICHGTSDRQVEAIAEGIKENVKKLLDEKPWLSEGFENKEWILLDYVNVVTHVFLKDKREFYSIEELWGDGKITTY